VPLYNRKLPQMHACLQASLSNRTCSISCKKLAHEKSCCKLLLVQVSCTCVTGIRAGLLLRKMRKSLFTNTFTDLCELLVWSIYCTERLACGVTFSICVWWDVKLCYHFPQCTLYQPRSYIDLDYEKGLLRGDSEKTPNVKNRNISESHEYFSLYDQTMH